MHRGADRGRSDRAPPKVQWTAGSRRATAAASRDAIDGLDDVGAGLPEDNEQDGGLAVGEAARADVFDGVGHGGDVADADRRAILITDDQRPVVLGLEQLIGGADRPGGRLIRERSPLARLALALFSAVRTSSRLSP